MPSSSSSVLHAPGSTRHDRVQRSATLGPGVISFAGGLPDPASFPKRDLAEALAAVLNEPTSSGSPYGWPEGLPSLRQYVAQTLRERGARIDAEQVLITSGAQQALVLALNARVSPGDCVAVDDVTYPGALDAIKDLGARPVSLSERARAFYVMPRISNPRGQRMSAQERRRLLRKVDEEDAVIIEDDAFGDITFDPIELPPLVAQAPGRVFHIGSFSKTLCPGLRIGWLASPPEIAEAALHAKQSQDLQAGGLAQALLDAYLSTGNLSCHLQKVRAIYSRRARLMQSALRRHLPSFRFAAPQGGFSVWLETDRHLRDEAVYEQAMHLGVTFDSAVPFRLNVDAPFALRLCFSSVPLEQIEPGIERLARAIARVSGRKP